jgi:hypothetical protein
MSAKKKLNTTMFSAIVVLALFQLVWTEGLRADTRSEFQPVDPNRIPAILTIISNRAKGNYDQIQTWQGKLDIVSDYLYEGDRAKEVFTEEIKASGEPPKRLLEHRETNIEFSLDAENELLCAKYYSDSAKPLQYEDLETGRDLQAKVVLATRRAILTPEYQIDCIVDTTQDGVAKARKAVKQARPKNSSRCVGHPVYDPRDLFDPRSPVWLSYPRIVEHIKKKGKYVVDDRYALKVERRVVDGDVQYRVHRPARTSLEGGNVWLVKTFSTDAGYNMISSEFTRVNGELIDRRSMEYQSVQGIYVPSKVTEESFDPQDGSLQYQKTQTFKNVLLNHPIPAETFTYKNLGLEDGDDFEDRILDKKYVYKQGELVEVPKRK